MNSFCTAPRNWPREQVRATASPARSMPWASTPARRSFSARPWPCRMRCARDPPPRAARKIRAAGWVRVTRPSLITYKEGGWGNLGVESRALLARMDASLRHSLSGPSPVSDRSPGGARGRPSDDASREAQLRGGAVCHGQLRAGPHDPEQQRRPPESGEHERGRSYHVRIPSPLRVCFPKLYRAFPCYGSGGM